MNKSIEGLKVRKNILTEKLSSLLRQQKDARARLSLCQSIIAEARLLVNEDISDERLVIAPTPVEQMQFTLGELFELEKRLVLVVKGLLSSSLATEIVELIAETGRLLGLFEDARARAEAELDTVSFYLNRANDELAAIEAELAENETDAE